MNNSKNKLNIKKKCIFQLMRNATLSNKFIHLKKKNNDIIFSRAV